MLKSQTQTQTYRIKWNCPSQGIERTLPYILEDQFVAGEVVNALNEILAPEYNHSIITEVHSKEPAHANHGRHQRGH
jgi:hypothetical protein